MNNLVLFLMLVLGSSVANGQFFSSTNKIANVVSYHTTVGTTTAAAIPSASVTTSIESFMICNDVVNTSTYLMVGNAADVATDGIRLDKGQCFTCELCKARVLTSLKVKGQAASNGYSVIQFKP